MKKLLTLSIFLVAISLGIGLSYAQETDKVEIPSWVKGVANFWVEDKINDLEFAEALEFLIDSKIIELGNTTVASISLQTENERLQADNDQLIIQINELENEVKNIGLHNSKLLTGITEKILQNKKLANDLKTIKDEFKTYKKDNPLKVGNIGNNQVREYSTIDKENKNLQQQIQAVSERHLQLEEELEDNEEQIETLLEKNTELANQIHEKNIEIETLQSKITELEQVTNSEE